jgi:hypothetical protein
MQLVYSIFLNKNQAKSKNRKDVEDFAENSTKSSENS